MMTFMKCWIVVVLAAAALTFLMTTNAGII